MKRPTLHLRRGPVLILLLAGLFFSGDAFGEDEHPTHSAIEARQTEGLSGQETIESSTMCFRSSPLGDIEKICRGEDDLVIVGPDPLVVQSRPFYDTAFGTIYYQEGSGSLLYRMWVINCSDRMQEISKFEMMQTRRLRITRYAETELVDADIGTTIYSFDPLRRIEPHRSIPLFTYTRPRGPNNYRHGTYKFKIYCADSQMGDSSNEVDNDEGTICARYDLQVENRQLKRSLEQCRQCEGKIIRGGFGNPNAYCNCKATDHDAPCEVHFDCQGRCLMIRGTGHCPQHLCRLSDVIEPKGICSPRKSFVRRSCVVEDSRLWVDKCSEEVPEKMRQDFGCDE